MPGLKDKIRRIKNDHVHGSSFLLREIIKVFLTTKESEDEILWSFSELSKIDSTMVVIHHFLRELKSAIGHDFHKRVQHYQGKWKNVNIDIAMNLQDHLSDKKLTVLTHSHSGAIISVLRNLVSNGYLIDVIQTASEPGGEGHVQAKALKQLGSDVTIIKDENLSSSIKQVNCCFLGVDQYDKNSFVNKLGSKAIVEAAALFNKPVFVLGDSRKRVKSIDTDTTGLFEMIRLESNVHLINEMITNQ
jgi:translation initiation factor 2B subunit (eIF-2B alpha/beta/delta family)